MERRPPFPPEDLTYLGRIAPPRPPCRFQERLQWLRFTGIVAVALSGESSEEKILLHNVFMNKYGGPIPVHMGIWEDYIFNNW